jgi:hypothetical protein
MILGFLIADLGHCRLPIANCRFSSREVIHRKIGNWQSAINNLLREI